MNIEKERFRARYEIKNYLQQSSKTLLGEF
jgi:hypothetical protein